MISLHELLMRMDPAWQAVLVAAGAGLWLAALRRVLRDLRRQTAVGPPLARCGPPREMTRPAGRRAPARPDGNRQGRLAHIC
jgi:hypothetical protein